MVWSSPPMTSPSASGYRQDAPEGRINSRDQDSESDSCTLDSTLDPGFGLLPVRAQGPPSYTDDSLPSTPNSFSTSSSDLIFTRPPPHSGISMDEHAPSTQSWSSMDQEFLLSSEDDEVDSLTQGFANFGTFSTIPSAQPISPRPLPSPLEFSASSQMSGMLPSPPLTQPQYDSSPDYSTSSAEGVPSAVPRQLSGGVVSEVDESELLSSVVDGIAQLHVTMERDDAGRWRIRRLGTTEDVGL